MLVGAIRESPLPTTYYPLSTTLMLTNNNASTIPTRSPEEIYLEKFIVKYCDRTKTSKQLAQAFRPISQS